MIDFLRDPLARLTNRWHACRPASLIWIKQATGRCPVPHLGSNAGEPRKLARFQRLARRAFLLFPDPGAIESLPDALSKE